MPCTINASTTSGLIQTADTSGNVTIQTNGTETARFDTSQQLLMNIQYGGYDANATGAITLNANAADGTVNFKKGIVFSSDGGSPQNVWAHAGITSTGSSGFNGNLIFGTDGTGTQSSTITERMRIDSSGNVMTGTTSYAGYYAGSKFSAISQTAACAATLATQYAGDVSSPALYLGKYDNNTTTSQIFVRFLLNNAANPSGQINANGANAVAFGSWSDERLKENIEPLSSQLDNILALKPCEFDFKDGSGHQIGFIAQEMQEVYPDAVGDDGTEDKYLTVTGWSKTEARLVKAIQEQQTIINDLKARITALEGAN